MLRYQIIALSEFVRVRVHTRSLPFNGRSSHWYNALSPEGSDLEQLVDRSSMDRMLSVTLLSPDTLTLHCSSPTRSHADWLNGRCYRTGLWGQELSSTSSGSTPDNFLCVSSSSSSNPLGRAHRTGTLSSRKTKFRCFPTVRFILSNLHIQTPFAEEPQRVAASDFFFRQVILSEPNGKDSHPRTTASRQFTFW